MDEDERWYHGVLYYPMSRDGAWAHSVDLHFSEDYKFIDDAWVTLHFEDSDMDYYLSWGDMNIYSIDRNWDVWCSDWIWEQYEWNVWWQPAYPEYEHIWNDNGWYFTFTNDAVFDWWTANALCHEYDGHLAVIHKQEDLDSVHALIQDPNQIHWLGATDEMWEGEWQWVDGSYTWDHLTNWSPGQPDDWNADEDCLTIMWDTY